MLAVLEKLKKSTNTSDSESQNNSDNTNTTLEDSEAVDTDDLLENGPLDINQSESPLLIATTSKVSSTLSGQGVALGYISALGVQLATILIIKATGSSMKSLRYAIFAVGCWWMFSKFPWPLSQIKTRTTVTKAKTYSRQ